MSNRTVHELSVDHDRKVWQKYAVQCLKSAMQHRPVLVDGNKIIIGKYCHQAPKTLTCDSIEVANRICKLAGLPV